MAELAIIGGSGFTKLKELSIIRREIIKTPYGEPSAPLTHGDFNGTRVIFLPRHGAAHTIPPHKVNYRANLWALSKVGVQQVVAVAAVGGIREDMSPGSIVIPDQIIDYTYGRDHTYFETDLANVMHIDFTEPYSETLRQALMLSSQKSHVPVIHNGTYGATQGPRLESRSEINRMERDGVDLVGMTGMPETALAREIGLEYACCAVVANWAAGRNGGPITMDAIEQHLSAGMDKTRKLLSTLVRLV